VRKIIYWTAGILAAHLAFYGFTGIALWSPFIEDDRNRATALTAVHLLALIAFAVQAMGDSTDRAAERSQERRELEKYRFQESVKKVSEMRRKAEGGAP
jgi:uncharacterized membrane protein YeiB